MRVKSKVLYKCIPQNFHNFSWYSFGRTVKLMWLKRKDFCSAFYCPMGSKRQDNFPTGNNLFKVNKRNTRTMFRISSKLIIKAPKQLSLNDVLLTSNRFKNILEKSKQFFFQAVVEKLNQCYLAFPSMLNTFFWCWGVGSQNYNSPFTLFRMGDQKSPLPVFPL